MCGRARCSLRADDVPRSCRRNHCSVRTVRMDRYRPPYNVAPGSNVPVVRREDGSEAEGMVLQCMKWGLIPSFTKKSEKPDHLKMFNAWSESIGKKATFRRLIPKNRCLVAVEGFYEWKKEGSKNQPCYIHFKDGRPLVFAALYGEIIHTFTIVTTSSSSALAWLHDRMPVIFGDYESSEEWLNCSSSKVDTLLKPYEDPDLIKLKTDGTIPILKIFTAKGPKKEVELNPEEKVTKVDASESVKEEPESKAEDESKPSVPSLPQGCHMKWEYDEISTDSKLAIDEAKKMSAAPSGKRVKLKSPGDHKQPSVLAYLGKK